MKRERENETEDIDSNNGMSANKQMKTETKTIINQEKQDIISLRQVYEAGPSKNGEEKENEVGISVYLRSFVNNVNDTFSGITKQRYSDFIVREIDPEGNVARISDEDEMEDESSDDEDEKETPSPPSLTKEQIEKGCNELQDIPGFDKENKDAVKDLLYEIVNDRETREKGIKKLVETKVTLGLFNKENRIRVHQTVRTHFGEYLESNTDIHHEKNTDTEKVLALKEANIRGKLRRHQPKFCKFTLQKTNCSSADAVRLLGKMFHCNDKKFDVAGTKDKRGITTQFMTAYKLNEEHLKRVFRNYKQDKLAIDTQKIQLVKDKLRLGDLRGNQFEIGLRNLESDAQHLPKVIHDAVESLKSTGFINYFGMQRFGNFDIMTHEMGMYLLKEDIKSLIACMLLSRTTPKNYYSTMRMYLEKEHNHLPLLGEHTWTEAHGKQLRLHVQAELTKARMYNEKRVIDHLFKNPNDYMGAFMKLNRNTRMMYAHAVQSYVWNHAASARIEKYGVKMVVGDIIQDKKMEKQFIVLTKENFEKYIQEGYTIKDVVLPLFGFDLAVGYPTHEIGEAFYEQFFQKHELSLNTIAKMKKQYCLFGAYRHLIIQPENVSHRLVQYEKVEEDIMSNPASDSGNALIIQFDLPCGSYATMLLRELMHLPSILNWDVVNRQSSTSK